MLLKTRGKQGNCVSVPRHNHCSSFERSARSSGGPYGASDASSLVGDLRLLLLSLISTTPAYARQYHGHGHARFYYGLAYGGWYAPWSFYYPPYLGAYWYP